MRNACDIIDDLLWQVVHKRGCYMRNHDGPCTCGLGDLMEEAETFVKLHKPELLGDPND